MMIIMKGIVKIKKLLHQKCLEQDLLLTVAWLVSWTKASREVSKISPLGQMDIEKATALIPVI